MDSVAPRTIASLPLRSLARDGVALDGQRGRQLGEIDIRDHLRVPTVPFAIADIGLPLAWFDADARFDLWKNEIRERLVAPQTPHFYLSDFPGEYCYVATEWLHQARTLCVLFEKHH